MSTDRHAPPIRWPRLRARAVEDALAWSIRNAILAVIVLWLVRVGLQLSMNIVALANGQ